MKSPGPVITCNRKPTKEYQYWFREYFSGSEVLTQEMKKILPAGKVAAPADIKRGPQDDLRDKKVYER